MRHLIIEGIFQGTFFIHQEGRTEPLIPLQFFDSRTEAEEYLSEWLKSNLSDEELASYIAEKMLV